MKDRIKLEAKEVQSLFEAACSHADVWGHFSKQAGHSLEDVERSSERVRFGMFSTLLNNHINKSGGEDD